jgi:hypothetical protein
MRPIEAERNFKCEILNAACPGHPFQNDFRKPCSHPPSSNFGVTGSPSVQRRRRGIFVDYVRKHHQAPSGAAYSDVAPLELCLVGIAGLQRCQPYGLSENRAL